MNPSRPFILRPVATTLAMVAILLAGLVAYKQLPVSALPQVDYPTIQTFTFYPKPQVGADSPKLQHASDGSVWYTARTGTNGATGFGVLYPDMDKITNLGAYYLNGPPGYAFKPASERQGTR